MEFNLSAVSPEIKARCEKPNGVKEDLPTTVTLNKGEHFSLWRYIDDPEKAEDSSLKISVGKGISKRIFLWHIRRKKIPDLNKWRFKIPKDIKCIKILFKGKCCEEQTDPPVNVEIGGV